MFKRYKLFIIIVSILGLAFLGLVLSERVPIPIGCPFKALTGIPCPGCGGIRAVQHIFRGEILEALYMNPLSCILFIFMCIMPFWAFYDGYKEKNTLMKFLRTPWPTPYLIILFIVLAANWIWNIIKHL